MVSNNQEYNKRYYQKHRERLLENAKVYRENNKQAIAISSKIRRDENKEEINKNKAIYRESNREKIRASDRERYQKDPETILLRNKQYRDNNPEKIAISKRLRYERDRPVVLAKNAKYRVDNLEWWREYHKGYCKNRSATDPVFKLSLRIRTLIRNGLIQRGWRKQSKTNEILGCNLDQLHAHLVASCIRNYGAWFDWEPYEIDHIIPLATAKTEAEVYRLNHYTNLQYLKPKDNRVKRDRLDFTLEVFND